MPNVYIILYAESTDYVCVADKFISMIYINMSTVNIMLYVLVTDYVGMYGRADICYNTKTKTKTWFISV